MEAVAGPAAGSGQSGTVLLGDFDLTCDDRRADAVVAQLVEHDLPKLGVAGSNPVRRSERSPGFARLRSRGFFLVVHRAEVMRSGELEKEEARTAADHQ